MSRGTKAQRHEGTKGCRREKEIVEALVFVLAISFAKVSWAEGVQTAKQWIEGPVALVDGGMKVGDKTVAWGDLLYAEREAPRTVSSPNALVMRSGEVWKGRLIRCSSAKARFAGSIFEERDIELAQIEAMEFVGNGAPTTQRSAGTLYRASGEPIPCSVLWIDATRIAVDSPLGVMTLGREGTVSYVLPAAKTEPAGDADEVHLIDGSIYRGKVTLAGGKAVLQHAMLGKVEIPQAAVKRVLRAPAGAGYLRELSDRVIGAGESVAVKLPARDGKRMLRARVAMAEGSKGDVKLKVSSGGKVVLEKVIAGPQEITVELPAGDVAFEAEVGTNVGYPCGVVVRDAFVISEK